MARMSKGFLAGFIGGLVASWTMNEFQAGLSKIEEAWKRSGHRPEPPQAASDEDDATMTTADRIAEVVLHRHLTKDEKKKAGPVVHYAYGSLIGGIYGALAELAPVTAKGTGTAYATAVWLFGDEIALPKLGLSKPPTEYPLKVHAKAWASHVIYGVTADAVRRAVRQAI